MRGRWAADLYVAADAFVERCLRQGTSLIDPTRNAWSGPAPDDFYERFVVNEDDGEGRFIGKLLGQLVEAPAETTLLAADIVYLYYLPIHEMTQATRRKNVEQVLALSDGLPKLEPMLDQALTTGLARYGQAKTQPWRPVRFLAELARSWSRIPDNERERLLTDPWAFKEYLGELPNESPLEMCALEHMIFPDTFEPIISMDIKRRIAKTFADVNGVEAEQDVDRKLAHVREALVLTLGSSFQFWDAQVEPVWRGERTDPPWVFAEFARKFRELPRFDEHEVDYKRTLAERLARARVAVLGDEGDWLEPLKKAFAAPNNITSWRQHVEFLKWCESESGDAHAALELLWSADSPDDADVAGFIDKVPATAIDSPGGRANVVSYLFGAWGADQWVNYKPTASERALALSGLEQADTGDVLARITRFSALIDQLRVRVVALGGRPASRLEAQGMAWFVTGEEVPDEWTQDDRAALVEFRAGGAQPPPPRPPASMKAWYFRGFSLPDRSRAAAHWVEGGFVSTFWAELGPVAGGTTMAELLDRVKQTFPDDPPGRWRTTAGNIYRFASAIVPGDLVVTTEGQSIFVGRVTGESSWEADAHPYLQRRRSVEWLNAGSPASRDQLSTDLQAVLTKPLAVSKIAYVDEVAALVGLAEPPPPPPAAALPDVTPEVAGRLFFDVASLQEIVELLREKRQLIFFGPPGTGKTLVAQVLADHLTAAGGESQLVQFHPSYAYEDFMEGYRPSLSDDGAVSYELREGPFRRIVDAALDDPANPYILVVDEINRGNIPKIFGELLFLLEYRDRPIGLQYSEQLFSLPPNVYVIGTMNTADRSIALVDAALRRRFYFVPFLPSEAPVKEVLGRWLAEHERDDLPARLLDALNAKIAKDEVAIGPSYLMTGDGTDASLRRIWRYAIMPLLEEHYYGTKHDVEKEFGLDACLAALREVTAAVAAGSADGDGVETAEPEASLPA